MKRIFQTAALRSLVAWAAGALVCYNFNEPGADALDVS